MEIESATLRDYVALFRRRRAVMFAAFSAIAIVLVFGTFLLEDQYRSTATIAIERSEIPENMVRTTFTYYDTDLRIDRIRDRVLSTANVENWINEFDLYPDVVASDGMSIAISRFRQDVEVITIQAREDLSVREQGETIAFNVSYYGESPKKALQVAQVLADQFLYENRASRSESVMDTVEFFQRDADRLTQQIDEAEANLADFKERNSLGLPNSAFANTQVLDRYERELDDVEGQMRSLRESRQILETDLAKESPYAPIFSETGEAILAGPDRLRLLQQQLVELSARYGPGHPDVIRTRREIELLSGNADALDANAIRRELEVARREYLGAQQRYASDHPDVVNLANRVRALEAQLAAANASPNQQASQRPDNPAYLSILVQIDAADEELAALRARASELRSRIGQYERLIAESPQVEREYMALQRRYDQLIADYNEVREKQTEAQQALNLETSEKGERYVLQHTPAEPTAPAFPNRLAIIILGMILAVFFSFGAVFVAEAFDSKVRGVRDLKILTGASPIAVIPVLETKEEQRRRRLSWIFSIAGVASVLFLTIAAQV